MRSSKKSTVITFSILIIVLVGAILFNYVRTQMSKNAAKHYVPVVKKEATKNGGKTTKSNNPAKPFTLTGPITAGKSVSELKYQPGFYDIHITGGETQYLAANWANTW